MQGNTKKFKIRYSGPRRVLNTVLGIGRGVSEIEVGPDTMPRKRWLGAFRFNPPGGRPFGRIGKRRRRTKMGVGVGQWPK